MSLLCIRLLALCALERTSRRHRPATRWQTAKSKSRQGCSSCQPRGAKRRIALRHYAPIPSPPRLRLLRPLNASAGAHTRIRKTPRALDVSPDLRHECTGSRTSQVIGAVLVRLDLASSNADTTVASVVDSSAVPAQISQSASTVKPSSVPQLRSPVAGRRHAPPAGVTTSYSYARHSCGLRSLLWVLAARTEQRPGPASSASRRRDAKAERTTKSPWRTAGDCRPRASLATGPGQRSDDADIRRLCGCRLNCWTHIRHHDCQRFTTSRETSTHLPDITPVSRAKNTCHWTIQCPKTGAMTYFMIVGALRQR